jgi:DNA repair exonuclease SbcCD ATPase subunit
MTEIDELEKRLTWLDSERQKDKVLIKNQQDALEKQQDLIQRQNAEIKKLATNLKSISSLPARIEQLSEENSDTKTEMMKKMMELEKGLMLVDNRIEQSHKSDIENINKKLLELKSEIKPINALKKTISERVEEEFRITQKVDSVSEQIRELQTTDGELQRQLTSVVGERRHEVKRITDLQLETTTLKKHIEEILNNHEVNKEVIRKINKRFDEVIATEKERKQNQTAFLEKVSLDQVEKNSLWKEWQEQYAEMRNVEPAINAKMLEFNEAVRSIKKTQSEFEEINDRFNRRINEISEMNRLAEERFRQEWIAFKADDQKRWTNYTLTREEESREDARSLGRVNDRLAKIEDSLQVLQDTTSLLIEETKRQITGLNSATQEIVESFNQTFKKR